MSMEKYLLVNNYSNYSYDDDELISNVYVVGSYDCVEKCVDACEDELIDQAKGFADFEELPEKDRQSYIDSYVDGFKNYGLLDDDFAKEGGSKYVAEHRYDGVSLKIRNQFLVIRIA